MLIDSTEFRNFDAWIEWIQYNFIRLTKEYSSIMTVIIKSEHQFITLQEHYHKLYKSSVIHTEIPIDVCMQ